ncbi:N-acyl-D-amino-acid deacylase family protein [Desulfoluna spongiiphila]|uniref:N-acyl-D-amino-acid deacylase n=1 Tax=Desulfoluna spongiiphila TaxID=419481 RepID=A0A1G5GL75_9BACT|nr:amidohydrolase family protein [Desulfoluna spongiiphila]SCY51438.1 N-acyl-D-amino-acid deacylase [Desulfoluna spongiiphila]
MLDIKLTNGTIIDGTGSAAYKGDIGITGDKITCLGCLDDTEAKTTVDVTGHTVCPGFIDIHTHSDTVLLADGSAQSQIRQGVTFEVCGQCGASIAPYENVENMRQYSPLPLLTPVDWDSFGSYLDCMDRQALGLNVASMVGHGALRINCMASPQGTASNDEITAMEAMLDQCLEQGALGLSFGLEYEPGFSSATEELERLCAVVAKHKGIAAMHSRDRARYYDTGIDEAIALARNTGVTMQVSHINPKYGRPDNGMQRILDAVLNARKEGINVYMDVMGVNLNHTNIAAILPTWATEGSPQDAIKRLKDPVLRQKIKVELKPVWQIVREEKWDKVWLLNAAGSPDLVGLSFTEISEKLGRPALDCAFDIMINEGERLRSALWTSRSFSYDDVAVALQDPECPCISDGFAMASEGLLSQLPCSLHTFDWVPLFLDEFVTKRRTLTIEEAIRRLTSVPARRVDISDRGMIKPGHHADIAIFETERFKPCATFANPRTYPKGMVHVLCNGEFVMKNGERQPANPGRVIRR